MSLKQLFVKDYGGNDEDDYSSAVYTQQDVYDSLFYVLDQVNLPPTLQTHTHVTHWLLSLSTHSFEENYGAAEQLKWSIQQNNRVTESRFLTSTVGVLAAKINSPTVYFTTHSPWYYQKIQGIHGNLWELKPTLSAHDLWSLRQHCIKKKTTRFCKGYYDMGSGTPWETTTLWPRADTGLIKTPFWQVHISRLLPSSNPASVKVC